MRIQISTKRAKARLNGPWGKPSSFGPACRLRQLGLGAGEIAAHEADQGQVDVRRRDRVVGIEPHRVDLVLVCCGQARGGPLEVGTRGIEFAAQEHATTPKQASITGRNHCRPSSRPARSDSSTWATRRRSARAR